MTVRRGAKKATAVGVGLLLGLGPGDSQECTFLAVEPGVAWLVGPTRPTPLPRSGCGDANLEGSSTVPVTVNPLGEAGTSEVDPHQDLGIRVAVVLGGLERDLPYVPDVGRSGRLDSLHKPSRPGDTQPEIPNGEHTSRHFDQHLQNMAPGYAFTNFPSGLNLVYLV